jgi:hypothetical protein
MANLEDYSQEARDELAKLMLDLSENIETRPTTLRDVRKVRPNMPIPEIDTDNKLQAINAQAAKRIDSLESKLRERDATEELQRRRNKLAERFGPDNVEQIEKIMLDKGIQSHDTAGDYFDWMRQAQAPTPSSFSPNVMDKSTREGLKSFFTNPQLHAREVAHQALQDLKKAKRWA